MKKTSIIILLLSVTLSIFAKELDRSSFGIGINFGLPHLMGLEINQDISDDFSIRGIGMFFSEDIYTYRGDLLYRLYSGKHKDLYIFGGYSGINLGDNDFQFAQAGLGYEYNWQKIWPNIIPIYFGIDAAYIFVDTDEIIPFLFETSMRFHF